MVYYAIELPNPWTNIEGKPYVTVSAKGIANGLSDIPNDGADFGPDTPGTQTSGIQEAINSIPNGGKIIIRNGAYNIQTTITVNNEMTIEGANTVYLIANGANPIMQVNASQVVISNVQFQANNATTTALVLNGKYIVVDNAVFFNLGAGTGILIQNNYNTVMNSMFLNMNAGIVIQSYYPSTSRILNNQFRNINQGTNPAAINILNNGVNDIIAHNYIDESCTLGINIPNPVALSGQTTQGSEGITIIENTIAANTAINIINLFVGFIGYNILDQATNQVIYLGDSSVRELRIANNYISSVQSTTSNGIGIDAGGVVHVIIENNIIEQNYAYGIRFRASSTIYAQDIVIKNNTFNANNRGGLTNIYDLLLNTTQDMHIEDNIFTSSSVTNSIGLLYASGAPNLTGYIIHNYVTKGIATNGAPGTYIIKDNIGYTPTVTTPAVPSSGTAVTNTNPFPVKVYVNGGALTQIQITVNGTAYTVYSNSTASAVYEEFTLPAYASITLTYSTAPTWTWVPE